MRDCNNGHCHPPTLQPLHPPTHIAPPHTPQQQQRQGIFAGTHYLNWTLTLIIQPLISNPCWPTFSIRLEKNTKISSSDNLLPVAKLSDSEKRPSPLFQVRFPNFSLLVGQNVKMIICFPTLFPRKKRVTLFPLKNRLTFFLKKLGHIFLKMGQFHFAWFMSPDSPASGPGRPLTQSICNTLYLYLFLFVIVFVFVFVFVCRLLCLPPVEH